jgi:hypothetical protein
LKLVVTMIALLGTMVGVPSQTAEGWSRLPHETVHLHFTSVPNYAFGIAGNQWDKFARVTVTLRANRMAEQVMVLTTAAGSFLIGVNAADLCATTSAGTHDEAHHRVARRGPQKTCLVILESSPRLTILRGRSVPLSGQQARELLAMHLRYTTLL